MLIKEITRRVNKKGIWQAVYTAGTSSHSQPSIAFRIRLHVSPVILRRAGPPRPHVHLLRLCFRWNNGFLPLEVSGNWCVPGVVLPTPVAECRYWHRSLNPKKLVEVGFSGLGQRMTISRSIKLYKASGIRLRSQVPDLRIQCFAIVDTLAGLVAYVARTSCVVWLTHLTGGTRR